MTKHMIQRPPKLHELVAQRMQDLVFGGHWKLGSRLPTERELCRQFGVSRTVVREALKVLMARGLLKEPAGKGTIVSQSVSEPLKSFVELFLAKESSNGYVHLFEVRSFLEVEIAGLAAERATQEEIENLERINTSLRRLNGKAGTWSQGDTTRFNQLDFQFHLALAKCTKNDLFVILFSRLSDALMSAWARMCLRSEVRQHGIQMHEKIFEAIRVRDARAARRATRENLKCFLVDASAMAQVNESQPTGAPE